MVFTFRCLLFDLSSKKMKNKKKILGSVEWCEMSTTKIVTRNRILNGEIQPLKKHIYFGSEMKRNIVQIHRKINVANRILECLHCAEKITIK